MTVSRATTGDRVKAATIALLVEAALGYMLVSALGYHVSRLRNDDLKLFGVAPPPPPDRVPPPRPAMRRPAAAAAPRNLRAKATPVVVPSPVVRLIVPPPPVVAATVPEHGPAPSAGAADLPGPGTGAGGVGDGFGGGGRGDGDGGGGRSERETPPRQIGGRLMMRDLPPELADSGAGVVWVRFIVEPDGSVGSCSVTHSSGESELDALTCRLIQERYRFRPSLDADHRPVASTVVESHGWTVRDEDRR